jgi:hypothetical protein
MAVGKSWCKTIMWFMPQVTTNSSPYLTRIIAGSMIFWLTHPGRWYKSRRIIHLPSEESAKPCLSTSKWSSNWDNGASVRRTRRWYISLPIEPTVFYELLLTKAYKRLLGGSKERKQEEVSGCVRLECEGSMNRNKESKSTERIYSVCTVCSRQVRFVLLRWWEYSECVIDTQIHTFTVLYCT